MNFIEYLQLEDIFEAIFRGLFKLIGYIVKDFILEIIVKGTGYLMVRCYRQKSKIDPDGIEVVVLGMGFWVSLIAVTIIA